MWTRLWAHFSAPGSTHVAEPSAPRPFSMRQWSDDSTLPKSLTITAQRHPEPAHDASCFSSLSAPKVITRASRRVSPCILQGLTSSPGKPYGVRLSAGVNCFNKVQRCLLLILSKEPYRVFVLQFENTTRETDTGFACSTETCVKSDRYHCFFSVFHGNH